MALLFVLAGASGVAAHLTLYRFGEWDLKGPNLVISYLLLLLVCVYIERLDLLYTFSDVAPELLQPTWAVGVVGYHIAGIYLSMFGYRLLWHRLRRFPGPVLASLSNLYVTALSAKKMHLYEEVEKLHKQYGDYVRLGPSELSIADPQAVRHIYSGQAKVRKGPWYTVLEPRVSLHMIRDKQEHSRRRKAWDQAFSSKGTVPGYPKTVYYWNADRADCVAIVVALRNYEPRVSRYTEQLIDTIRNNTDKPFEVSKWFNYYSFDVMGDLSFGKSFNMLEDGEEKYFLKQLHADMKTIGLFSHLTWLFPFFKRIPVMNSAYLKLVYYIRNRVRERVDHKPDSPDVFSWILNDFEQGSKTTQDQLDLEGDCQLIMIAGSDTTAATLTNIFFHLAADRHWQSEVQEELDALSNLSYENLVNIKLLNAIINETLRLHPVVPSGTQRVTPPEGLMIGNTYIPGDIIVCIPSHTLFRDERVFSRPCEFVPERWTTQPELVKDPSAFIPFNAGPYSCVGKQLGLMELRHVTAQILTRFDVSFAPGQTVDEFLRGKTDHFTLLTAPLKLVFRKRERNTTAE